jgi:poly(A) polymerase
MLGMLREPTATLALGVLLHDVAKPPTYRVADRIRFDGHAEMGARMAAGIMTRLRFSNEEIRQVENLVAQHLRFKDVRSMRESTLKRFIRQPHFDELLELHRLDCVASHGWLENHEFVRLKLRESPPDILRPPRLITGEDLIRAGYTPGPPFQAMLGAVEDAQLEGRIRSREEALALVGSLFGRP